MKIQNMKWFIALMFTPKFAYADYVFNCYGLDVTRELIRRAYLLSMNGYVPDYPVITSISYLYNNEPIGIFPILGDDETSIAAELYRPFLIWSQSFLDWGVYFLGDNGYEICYKNPAYNGYTFRQIAFGNL
ncbi:CSEP0063 putative effector protein [Blumeria hordei DH14]|uniref:CSEP0063 putative effector protein n=1 Tax=Blumeria graminis f. sp. hordei (strain DH14) TaxID=546991 RepID=N1JI65_BLUG1|nr:CSEP0063 putative effector protein [Blumeria hordei DH14]